MDAHFLERMNPSSSLLPVSGDASHRSESNIIILISKQPLK